MIPKEGKDLSRGGWRPITVGKLLARIFSGIIENRLKHETTLNVRQKGFVAGNDCFANVSILSKLYKLGKQSRLSLAILDVSKSFDSVPHQAIETALKAQGVSLTICKIIK